MMNIINIIINARSIKPLTFLTIICIIIAVDFSTLAYSATPDYRKECLKGAGYPAISACKRALKSSPQDIALHLRLGDLFLGLERYEEAAAVFKKAEVLKPQEKLIQKQKAAKSLRDEQEWIEKRRAKSSAETAKSKERIQIKLNRVKCIRFMGDKGLTACNEVLKALPEDPVLHNARGNILLQMDRIEEAKLAFMSALRYDPYKSEYLQKLLMLGPIPIGSSKSYISKRMELLKSLLDKGLISKKLFNHQKMRLLDTPSPPE
ncbi:MAG: hypothetical protein GY941_05780 [Planctomycetes bacterium]|nr:hypothetical protein [Planctomycetota bacterium]